MGSGAPQFTLTLGGQLLDEQTLRYVISIELYESIDEIDSVSIKLAVPETSTEISRFLTLAQPFMITLGYGTETLRQVSGDIVELHFRAGTREVRIATLRGLSFLYRLKQRRLTRAWNLPHTTIAQTIASEHQLSATVLPGSATPAYEFQNNESNAAFLHRLARRNNYEMTASLTGFSFGRRTPPPPLVLEAANAIIDLDIRQSLDEQPSLVVVRGWDYKTNTPVIGRSVPSLLPRWSGGKLGHEVAAPLLGVNVLEVDNSELPSLTACTAHAQALHQQKAELFVTGSLTVTGKPELLSGGTVTLLGFGAASARYLVRATTHTLEPKSGYRTRLSLCSDSLPAAGAL